MTRKYLIAFLLFVSAASTALAQFTPVVSKVRQTQETLVGGKVVKSVQREALYYRQSDGSYIFKRVSQTKDGESLPESTGAFWDNKTASDALQVFVNRSRRVPSFTQKPNVGLYAGG